MRRLFAICILIMSSVRAEEPAADAVPVINSTIVVTATRSERAVSDLPVSTTVESPASTRLSRRTAITFRVVSARISNASSLFGTKLDGPMEGHAPVLPVELHHWDLHVWLWKANPNGLMHPTNSTIKCPKSPYSFHEMGTKMVMKP